MAESNEITPQSEMDQRKPKRGRLLTVLLAALLAAVAAISFSVGSASAQTEDTDGGADQQQSDEDVDENADENSQENSDEDTADPDDGDDSDDDCDHDGTHRGGKHWRFGTADALTEVLGIDAETLRTKLKEGSTLADIAAEQGVEVSDVVDALVTVITDRAAEHDRDVDADELTAKITAMVNGEQPERSEDPNSGQRHRGGFLGKGRWGSHTHTEGTSSTASTTAA